MNVRTPLQRAWSALRSPSAQRIYSVLLALLVLSLWVNAVRRAMRGSGQYDDFTQFARNLLFEGQNGYEAGGSIRKYPPVFWFLFAPLAPMPIALGATIWFWMNLALAVGAAWVSALVVDETPGLERPRTALWAIPLVLASGIVGSNLETSQVNILIFFFVCLALWAFRRRQDLTAGMLLGFATALKLTPGLFILYFLYKRALRVVVGAGLAIAVCWLVVPLIVFGPGDFLEIGRDWSEFVLGYVTQGVPAEGISGFGHTNQSLAAAFYRFFTESPAGAGRPNFYLNVASLGSAAAAAFLRGMNVGILVLLAWLCRTPVGDRRDVRLAFEYSLVFIAALFLSPISWINHYVTILFPFAAATYYVRTRPELSPERRLLLRALVLSFLLVSSSASILMQALSLPVLGALLLAAALAYVLLREGRARVGAARQALEAGTVSPRPQGA